MNMKGIWEIKKEGRPRELRHRGKGRESSRIIVENEP